MKLLIQDIMKTQVRLLVGTVALMLAGALFFGVNLTIYGIASIIRWGIYIQGALLIITIVGWPLTAYDIVCEFFEWYLKFYPKNNIGIPLKDGLIRMKQIALELVPNGGRNDHGAIEYIHEGVDTAILIAYPQNGENLPPEELTHVFHPDHLQILGEKAGWREVIDPHRINGQDMIAEIEAETG